MVNQAEHIADALGHYSTYECKYGKSSINNLMPIVRKQGNAFLAAPRVEGERFHYFDTGIKRLIIELELDDVCIFLVHLALKYRQRQYQLRYLHDLIIKSHKPVIVTGDFNTFWGTHEIYLFMRAAGLRSANEKNLPSFPARIPRIELDFVLRRARRSRVTHFEVPDVRFSDHRPDALRLQRSRRDRVADRGRLAGRDELAHARPGRSRPMPTASPWLSFRQARHFHQRVVTRHAARARHAPASSRRDAAARRGDSIGQGVGLHRRRRREGVRRSSRTTTQAVRAGARSAEDLWST